jgi:hypothetical protein
VVDPPLDLGDHLRRDPADAVFEPLARLGRGRQLGAGDEEVVLEAEDVGGEAGIVGRAEGAGDAERRAGLVEGAVGVGAAVVLRDAAAVPERGGAVVALAGVDLDPDLILRRRRAALGSAAQPTGLKTSPVRTFG